MNPECIAVTALPTRLQLARTAVRWPLCIMSKWKTTEAGTSSVLDLCFQLSVTINNSCLGWDCVIFGAVQRVKWFFSAWNVFAMTCGHWQHPFNSLDKSTQEPGVLDFCLQSITEMLNSGGTTFDHRTDCLRLKGLSLTQRSQLCSHPTGFHNHSSKTVKV